MKKLLVMGMCVFAAVAANADFKPAAKKSGGFVAGNDSVVSVSRAKEMHDDARVILKGNIIEQIEDEKYTFKDDTGTITVEIDDEDWRGQTVTPNDKVKIHGEVDTSFMRPTEIEVEYIELL